LEGKKMPNYCTNDLTLTHHDAALVLKAHDAFKEGKLLEAFIPCPRPLRETEAVHYPKEPQDRETQIMAERQAAIEAINMKHYGFKNWYDWCIAHWGTKWDVGGRDGYEPEMTGNTLRLYFDSAWSPPTAAYDALLSFGFEVEAYYVEDGMGFCGYYNNGDDETYDIPETRDEVREKIPEHIDDRLDISARMAELEGDE
jgi:hypothetical protein